MNLLAAIGNRDVQRVRRTLQEGADPDFLDLEFGNTPLNMAIGENSPEIVKLLLQAGADPDFHYQNDRPPLANAIRSGVNQQIIRLLLDAGADVSRVQERHPLIEDVQKSLLVRRARKKPTPKITLSKTLVASKKKQRYGKRVPAPVETLPSRHILKLLNARTPKETKVMKHTIRTLRYDPAMQLYSLLS